ncbi:hypothetical protein [uncultured Ruminococcus sp.]|nr:hypothetical protein [uncultured Ruminococcus sp.]
MRIRGQVDYICYYIIELHSVAASFLATVGAGYYPVIEQPSTFTLANL